MTINFVEVTDDCPRYHSQLRLDLVSGKSVHGTSFSSLAHLQLGRELYDRKKFGKEDFMKLLEAEISSLESCLECLEHSSVGGYLDEVNFKAAAARDDAESWLCQMQEGTL